MGIRFEVTALPQFSVEELAVQLGESLQGSIDGQNDIRTYQEQIRVERRKITELELLITQVESFRSNMPVKVSRMEPMMQYDLDSLKEEVKVSNDRITDWEDIIQVAQDKIQRCQQDTIRLQKELSDRSKKG